MSCYFCRSVKFGLWMRALLPIATATSSRQQALACGLWMSVFVFVGQLQSLHIVGKARATSIDREREREKKKSQASHAQIL